MKVDTRAIAIVLILLLVGWTAPEAAQQGGSAPAGAAAASTPTPVRLHMTEGTQVRYRVREQLAGINFPSDAVGSGSAVKGSLVFRADGTIDGERSKLTFDLRTLQSDQELRDRYIQRLVLETEKFPTAEFTPRRAEGIPYPLPTQRGSQTGFKLVGDMVIHGVKQEVVWVGIATFDEAKVAGRAETTFPFAAFGLTKPSIARLMSVDDMIKLEIEFRSVKSPQ